MNLRAIAVAAVGLLGGCETVATVDSAVKTFYADDFAPEGQAPQGRTFVVAAAGGADPKSLEFRRYMDTVKAGLVDQGLATAPDLESADYIVRLGVSVGDAETRVTSEPIRETIGGERTIVTGTVTGPAGPETFTGSTFTPPRTVVVGTRTSALTVFTRVATIDIVEPAATPSAAERKVFEGTVTSTGEARDFAVVARCLFAAFFDVFPGENGGVTVISTPNEICKLKTAPAPG